MRGANVKGKRVALSLGLGYHEPAPAVRAAVEGAAKVFEKLGAVVEPADPFDADPAPVFQALALAAFWALLRSMKPEAAALMDPALAATARRGERVTIEHYLQAMANRAALGQRLRLFFERWDLLLCPTMPIPAAYADPREDGLPNPNNTTEWMPYTFPFNLTRNPAASINCGFADGLPVGLQVVGPLWGDRDVLAACQAYEAAAGLAWPTPALASALGRAAAAAGGAEVTAKIRRAS